MVRRRNKKETTPKLSDVQKIVETLVKPIVERIPVILTKHFRKRQHERHIDLFDVELALRKGRVVKEHQPDLDHPQHRWSMRHKDVTLVFNFNCDMKALLLITCWRKNKKRGNQ